MVPLIELIQNHILAEFGITHYYSQYQYHGPISLLLKSMDIIEFRHSYAARNAELNQTCKANKKKESRLFKMHHFEVPSYQILSTTEVFQNLYLYKTLFLYW